MVVGDHISIGQSIDSGEWPHPQCKQYIMVYIVLYRAILKFIQNLKILVQACATRGGGLKRSWPLFSPIFFFFYACWLSPTSGKVPWLKICFLSYFGITRRNIYKKIIFLKFMIFYQKNHFVAFFSAFYSQCSGTEPGPTPSPWSI